MSPFDLIARLNAARIHHHITSIREGALLIEASVPGEQWDIEVFEDGHVEIERFRSDGEITGEHALTELLTRFSENK